MASNADMVEQLLLKLQKSEHSRQEAEQRAQALEKKAQDEQKIRQEAERKLQLAEDRARGLSWPEALSLWHNVFSNPRIRSRYETIQPTGFTTAIGRRHPTKLVHWTTFHQEHESAFANLCNQLGKPEVGAFESAEFYEKDAGRFMKHCLLDDEVALVAYEQRTVEELVVNAWQQKGGDMIGFKSREDHALDDVTSRLEQMNTGTKVEEPTMEEPKVEEPKEAKPKTAKPKMAKPKVGKPRLKTPTAPDKSKRLYDKVCYIIVGKGGRRDLFVIEYKSADKLTPALVLEGLHDMQIDAIIHRVKIPTDKDEKRKEKAEDSIAIVLTQTYDYMIDQGLSYGYVNGGKTFIFLFLRPEEPQTLYYEKVILMDPSTTSPIVPDEQLRLTAVGLVAGFAQMALSKEPWGETYRSNARNELSTWRINDGKILESMTPEATSKKRIEDSPEFQESDKHRILPDTSPCQTRSRAKAKKDLARCQKGDSVLPRLRKDDDDSNGKGGHTRLGVAKSGFIQSSSTSGLNTTTESNGKKGSSNTKGQNKAAVKSLGMFGDYEANRAMPDRPYCTQACLLGLIRGHTLDNKCPNVKAHPKRARYYSRNTTNGIFKGRRQRNNWHAIDQPALARLLDEQLQRPERNHNGGFKSLDRSGWAGALFRLELLSHGYTFVGKGTVEPLVPVLEFEADMYKRMNTIQGKVIPVYLGSVDLTSAFHLTTRTAIVHLMLLSWGGEEAWRCGIEPERLWLETIRTNHEVAALGVQQGDLRPQNVLWNSELDRAILIDFEFAHIEEAEDKIRSAIAEKTEAKKKIKILGQTSGNRASRQAGIKSNQLVSSKVCDDGYMI